MDLGRPRVHRLQVLFPELRAATDAQGAGPRKRVLMDIYRARFGAVPREVQAAVTDAGEDGKLTRLIGVFASRNAEEIAAAVLAGKKPEKG